jgi:polysaccharide export outer membrane protein
MRSHGFPTAGRFTCGRAGAEIMVAAESFAVSSSRGKHVERASGLRARRDAGDGRRTTAASSQQEALVRGIAGWKLYVLAIAAAFAAGGCSYSGPTSTFEELGTEANTKGFGDLYPPDNRETGEFTFGIGDQILVSVPGSPEFDGPYVVRQDGKIFVQIVGDMEAAGLTTAEIKRKFENKLSVYLKPGFAVTVGVGNVISKVYYVAAHNPTVGGYLVRKLQHPGNLTLFDVWVNMGTPSTLLDDDTHVKVIRGDPRRPEVRTINVREILVAGRTAGNIQVKPNDIVYVPTTVFGKFNEVMQGIALPFSGLFRISSSIVQVDRSVRVIQGDSNASFGGYYGP